MLFNPRSMNNKIHELMYLLDDNSVDIAGICETWLDNSNNNITATIKSYGYSIIHNFRTSKRGGGTAVLYKSNLVVSKLNIESNFKSFEVTAAVIRCTNNVKLIMLIIYRPGMITALFNQELDSLISNIVGRCDYLLIAGDLNLHFEQPNDKFVKACNDVISSFGMQCQVSEPTHINGGILDQIISYSRSDTLQCSTEVDNLNNLGSDHYPVYCSVNIELSKKKYEKVSFRNIRCINRVNFSEDIEAVVKDFVVTPGSFSTTINNLNMECITALDTHAPKITKTFPSVTNATWFDEDYRLLRAKRRKAEKQWKKSGTALDRYIFCAFRNQATAVALEKKKSHFCSLLHKSNGNPKTLFRIINKEMDKNQSCVIPDYTDDMTEIVTSFNNYFVDKIQKIRASIDESSNFNNSSCCDVPELPSGILSEFKQTDIVEIKEIISEFGIKCCPDDLLPQSLLVENQHLFLPLIVDIVNISLSTGNLEGVKRADIIPLIKSHGLDPNIFKNYRPVSNLTFIGKLIERVVLKRLNQHLTDNNLNIDNQSAYKQNNSTETLLIRITNDILIASDKKSAVVVMLIDLSAAFDTVDHTLLLKILKNEIGLRGTVLKWFESFLRGRSQRVRIGEVISDDIVIMFGVPQGSVLGPVLFNIYIRSIYNIVENHGFNILGYADDHQIYKTFQPQTQKHVLSSDLQECFSLISKWMTQFYLQLNASKTQIIVFGPPNVLKQIHINGVNFAEGTTIRFVSTVNNLGFRMDSNLNMRNQIMETKRRCFRTIRDIQRIRSLLTFDQLKMVVNSLVVSCLDYCNSMYYGINESDLQQLQIIQNAAAKVIYGKYKYDHIDDDLEDLHWLNIRKRIIFKICLLVFKSLNGIAPEYLQQLISYLPHGHTLKLQVPKSDSTYGKRSFSSVGPRIWNKLPPKVTENYNIIRFKSDLKTFLFNLSKYDIENLCS